MKAPFVGGVVLYRANKQLPEWHDRGFQPVLPGIITKVWSSGAVNLRVADAPVDDGKVDIRVFLDHNAKDQASFVWVFGSTYGEGIDQWTWPKE